MQMDTSPTEQRPIKQSFFGSLRRDAHWKCLILTVLICGCLGAIAWCRVAIITTVVVSYYGSRRSDKTITQSSPCEDGYIYIPVAFVIMLYLVYLVECWHSHTRIELHHKVDVGTVYEKISNMRNAIPILWWKALCYHYVRKTRHVTRYRNGDSFTTTQVYYERINSHTAGSAFNFSQCGIKDMSSIPFGLEDYPATKIKFSKGFSFASVDAECEFDEQRSRFFRENERRDDYMETREGMDLLNVNFKEYMITFADPNNLPWYVSHVIFWIASCLLMSWPLRVIIEFKTAYVHYHVHKVFGTNYVECEPPDPIAQLTRVNTMTSTDLEFTIQNNYALVPSYSEALLMASNGTYEVPDANGNVTSPIYGAKRSVTYGSLSSATKQDALQRLPSGPISPSLRRCHSYTIVNGGLVIQNDMQIDLRFPSRPRRKSRLLIGPWRRDDTSSNPISSPSSPQECMVAINTQTSTVRVLGLNRSPRTKSKSNPETSTVRSLNLERRTCAFPLRSPSAHSMGPSMVRSARSGLSEDSLPCYDDALSMDTPLFENENDSAFSSRLIRTESARQPSTSQRQQCRTIMETSL
ncbi:transmembrane protein 151B-like [Mizuhopecten yessoensis]|uniref:transmembrane protein 151B-like n=1 Tax=Mizuhopecten yessoensis TaxID=6573 RepID=UPI000B45C2DF|nr:transmembrane protein 151B-like [Mizuhopecten yessoensis]